jgi:hypothetical protein
VDTEDPLFPLLNEHPLLEIDRSVIKALKTTDRMLESHSGTASTQIGLSVIFPANRTARTPSTPTFTASAFSFDIGHLVL